MSDNFNAEEYATDEYEYDLYWHALNYRSTSTKDAEVMWQELKACSDRLILREREACARVCFNRYALMFEQEALELCEAIRARKEST